MPSSMILLPAWAAVGSIVEVEVEAEVVADGRCLVMRLVGLYCIGIHKPINNPQATATGMVSQCQAERFLAFGLSHGSSAGRWQLLSAEER